MQGKVIARRYHKFFNLHEREETWIENVDFSKPHVVLEKLDGSMITPIPIGDKILWGTKMGVTDVAAPVAEFVQKNPHYHTFATMCARINVTPIFEWCSNQQRIVINHPKDRLILTAIRNNELGIYIQYSALQWMANRWLIPLAESIEIDFAKDSKAALEFVRAQENYEGLVIRFDSGHMVKVKTEWYCRIHKNKELVASERNVVELIINQSLDDVKPFLQPADLERVCNYETQFIEILTTNQLQLYDDAQKYTTLSRKQFALEIAPTLPTWERAMIFSVWDDCCLDNCFEAVRGHIRKNCTKNRNFTELKKTLFNELVYNEQQLED